MFCAIARLHPVVKGLCPLARITRITAANDIIPCNYSGIVDYMFPGGDVPARTTNRSLLYQLNSAVDAGYVTVPYFILKPFRYAPAIHLFLMPNVSVLRTAHFVRRTEQRLVHCVFYPNISSGVAGVHFRRHSRYSDNLSPCFHSASITAVALW